MRTCEYSNEHLSDFVDNRLTDVQSSQVQSHLYECGECRAIVTDLEMAKKAMLRLTAATPLPLDWELSMPAFDQTVFGLRKPRLMTATLILALLTLLSALAYLNIADKAPPPALPLGFLEQDYLRTQLSAGAAPDPYSLTMMLTQKLNDDQINLEPPPRKIGEYELNRGTCVKLPEGRKAAKLTYRKGNSVLTAYWAPGEWDFSTLKPVNENYAKEGPWNHPCGVSASMVWMREGYAMVLLSRTEPSQRLLELGTEIGKHCK